MPRSIANSVLCWTELRLCDHARALTFSRTFCLMEVSTSTQTSVKMCSSASSMTIQTGWPSKPRTGPWMSASEATFASAASTDSSTFESSVSCGMKRVPSDSAICYALRVFSCGMGHAPPGSMRRSSFTSSAVQFLGRWLLSSFARERISCAFHSGKSILRCSGTALTAHSRSDNGFSPPTN